MSMPTERPMASPSYTSRFFGGPPLSVIFRLILLSILVGVILKALGLDPLNILRSMRGLVRASGTWASTRCAGCGVISCSAP